MYFTFLTQTLKKWVKSAKKSLTVAVTSLKFFKIDLKLWLICSNLRKDTVNLNKKVFDADAQKLATVEEKKAAHLGKILITLLW